MKYYLTDTQGDRYVKDYDFISKLMVGVTFTPHKNKALRFDSKHIAELNSNYINQHSYIEVIIKEED